MKKYTNLSRGLFLLGLAGYFGYRYWQLGSLFYVVCIIILATVGLLGLVKLMPIRWQNLALNLGISLVFLDFVFAEIDLSDVADLLAAANYWMMIPATIFVLLHLHFRTLRSQWLLKSLGNVTYWPAYRALVIGIAGNTVLPARAGEFLRAYVIGRSSNVSKTGAFATIVVERIFDGLSVLLFLLVIIIFGVRDERFQLFGLLGGIFYIGAFVGLVIFILKRAWIDALVRRRLPEELAKLILELLDGFGSGLAVLKNPHQLGQVLLWNFFTWVTVPVSFWFVLVAFDFGSPVPWQAPVLMLPALGIALSVPGPPGGVGLFQTAVTLTLNLTYANLPKVTNFDAVAGATGILLHISQFGPEVLLGVISFVIEGLSADDLKAGRSISSEAMPAE